MASDTPISGRGARVTIGGKAYAMQWEEITFDPVQESATMPQLFNDDTASDEEVDRIRQQKAAEDLSCKPLTEEGSSGMEDDLPLQEHGYEGVSVFGKEGPFVSGYEDGAGAKAPRFPAHDEYMEGHRKGMVDTGVDVKPHDKLKEEDEEQVEEGLGDDEDFDPAEGAYGNDPDTWRHSFHHNNIEFHTQIDKVDNPDPDEVYHEARFKAYDDANSHFGDDPGFGASNKHGAGAVPIMRKVGKVVGHYMEEHQPKQFAFSAANNEPGRVKLYERFANHLGDTHGYDVEKLKHARVTSFYLKKKPTEHEAEIHKVLASGPGYVPPYRG